MASNGTPPHITALFDQQQATQHEHDQLPDGVICQIRVRPVDVGDDTTGLAATFMLDLADTWQAAALLLTLEGAVQEFASDVTHNLAQLMREGPDGFLDALAILRLIQDGRQARPSRVKRAGDSDD